jgi:hypothetical protein
MLCAAIWLKVKSALGARCSAAAAELFRRPQRNTRLWSARESNLDIQSRCENGSDQIFTLSLPIDSQPFPYHDANAIISGQRAR